LFDPGGKINQTDKVYSRWTSSKIWRYILFKRKGMMQIHLRACRQEQRDH